MTNNEILEKVHGLVGDESFREKIKSCRDYDEIASLFSAEGLDVTGDALAEMMEKIEAGTEEELSESALEDVAGGFVITGAGFLVFSICYSLSTLQLAYTVGKYGRKK